MARRHLIKKILISLIFLFIITSSVFSKDANWNNMDMTHKSPKDSVGWDNINTVKKPPKTGTNDKEHPGEKIGLHGPVITYGGKGKKEALVVYDPSGVVTCAITAAEAKKDPAAAQKKLEQACDGVTDHAMNRYFEGQILTENDLTQLTDYVQTRNRLYRPEIFGEGVVAGLDVATPGGPQGPLVTQGAGITSEGHLIDVPTDVTISGRGGDDTLRGTGSGPGNDSLGGLDSSVDAIMDDKRNELANRDQIRGDLTNDSATGVPSAASGDTPSYTDFRQVDDGPIEFGEPAVGLPLSGGGGDDTLRGAGSDLLLGKPQHFQEEDPIPDPNRDRQMSDNWAGGRNSWGEPLGGSTGPGFDKISPRLGFSYDVTGDGSHVVRSPAPWTLSRVAPLGFEPQEGCILQAGLTQDQLKARAKDITSRLIVRDRKGGFFKGFEGRPGVYRVVIIRIRRVQKKVKKKVDTKPNDPLFFVPDKRKKRKGLAGFLFGSGTVGKANKSDLGFGVVIGAKGKGKTVMKDQWALHTVGFNPISDGPEDPVSAWSIEDGSKKNVVVAVIDTGLYMEHPDGPEHIWTNPGEVPDNGIDDDGNGYIDDIHGWNFIDDNNDLTDTRGHGTFVSGIIAAKRDNEIGIAGINPGAQIMVLKVADHIGNSDDLRIWRALKYAADNGARIINISSGKYGRSPLEQLGINHAYNKGAFIVVAAGNSAEDISSFGPACSRRAFTVGALNREGTQSVISNYGPNVSLLAPGEDVYSLHAKGTDWQGPRADRERLYYKMSGTSFSAPIVTATASLLLAKNPKLTNKDIEDILLNTAVPLDEAYWNSNSGVGLLNAYAALGSKGEDRMVARLTESVITREKNKKIISVDLYGLIRGDVKSYVVELGKGKSPRKWKQIVESNEIPPEYGFIARLDGKDVSRGKYWVVRLTAKDKKGNMKVATLALDTQKVIRY
ncbi:S8 family peptidase [Thermoproteota archaeon]